MLFVDAKIPELKSLVTIDAKLPIMGQLIDRFQSVLET